MRAYFILYVITIKCISRMQEKTEFSCKLQRPTLISTKILGDLLGYEDKATKNKNKKLQKILSGSKMMAVATPCHPLATGMGDLHFFSFIFLAIINL